MAILIGLHLNMLKTSFLFAFLFPLLVSGQSSDTLVVQNYRIFISDTLLARYTRWDQVADTVQAYSHKQLAVVFEQKQYLLRHGLKAEVLLKQQYPLTEWQLLAFTGMMLAKSGGWTPSILFKFARQKSGSKTK